ncbi:MAG: hypothetical protein K8R68_01855 [Bacteroidales bacterium]|nr:hypothetical protein [Bacteroidales bacterium]
MKKSTVRVLIVLIVLFSNAYHLFADLKCFMLTPPEKVLENVQKIAVLNFDGKDEKGKLFADYLISELLTEDRGIRDIKGTFTKTEGKTYLEGARTNIFQLVERSQLERVLKEQGLGMSGVIDDTQAADVGKVLGLDALIIGSVSYTSVDKDVTETYTDYKTKQKYNVYCTVRTVKAEVRMKIISVSTGEILGNKDSSKSYQDKKCDEERSGLMSTSDLVDYCLKDVAYWMSNYFTPKFSLTEYDFEKIKMKEFKKQAKEARKLALKGMIDEAFPVYNALYEADPYNPKTAFNLAHLYQVVGDFDKAYELYTEAYEMEPKSKKYQKAYQEAEKLKDFGIIMKNIGVIIEKHDFSLVSGDALADKVKIKGSRSDRFEILSEPKQGSDVIAKVPGGLEFIVLEEKDSWYLIKLKGDKQGYIQKSKVK